MTERLFAVRAPWHALFFLVCAALLAACATPQRAPTPAQDVWSGRLALHVHSEPPQSMTAGFELRGSARSGELHLSSPLGTLLATLVWSPEGAELRQGSQLIRRASLDDLGTELGAAALPVAALFGWLSGQPEEASGWQTDLSRHAEGRVSARRSNPLPAAELRIVFK